MAIRLTGLRLLYILGFVRSALSALGRCQFTRQMSTVDGFEIHFAPGGKKQLGVDSNSILFKHRYFRKTERCFRLGV